MTTFQQFVNSLPVETNENPHWSLEQDVILNNKGQPLIISDYKDLLVVIKNYFSEWAKMGGLEAQVLVLTKEDYDTYPYGNFPTLMSPNDDYRLVVLPQINTPSNTIIDDNYWFKTVKGNPVMRVHSHHYLPAYQSQTDYNSLNSGTLEVVIGNVLDEQPTIAYWLTRFNDENAKNSVYKTLLT